MKKLILTLAGLAIAGISLTACGGPAATTPTAAAAPTPTAVNLYTDERGLSCIQSKVRDAFCPPYPAASATAPVTAAPAPSTVTFTGHGNESTPKFNTSGDFTVSWTFTGNTDTAFGQALPDNFSISMFSSGATYVGQTGQDLNFNDPNEIRASDSGNQTISGDDGSHYFTVDANGSCGWTFKITNNGGGS
jgi:hypothetical protein